MADVKKKNDDWMADVLKNSTPVNDDDWMAEVIKNSTMVDGLDPSMINSSDEAPASIRAEVGALEKPEDRLKALQKHYPDAQPYKDDNFIYTNPETGKVQQYNQEGWIPSLGDIASLIPEAGEAVGGGAGSILGGALGTLAGPVGTVGGSIAGAGVGSAAGREGAGALANWIFGNEDTRTGTERAIDAAQTAAMGAAGEGVGRALGAAGKFAKGKYNKMLLGDGVDDSAAAAQRIADFERLGLPYTVGMIAGSPKIATLEHALSFMDAGKDIARTQKANADQLGEFFAKKTDEISPKQYDVAEAGHAIKDTIEAAKKGMLDRSQQLYNNLGDLTNQPAAIDNTLDFAQNLKNTRDGLGEFQSAVKGPALDQTADYARMIINDARKSGTFDDLKQARTEIGRLAAEATDTNSKKFLDGLRASLTEDMTATAQNQGEDALQGWRKANNHYRRFQDEFGYKTLNDQIINSPDTDQIYGFAFKNIKNGGNQIAAIRRTMEKADGGKEAWNSIAAGIVQRAGMNNAGEFQTGTFVRNWNQLSDQAKDAIFKGTAGQQHREDLDTIARVSKTISEYAKHGNHSGTQNHATALGTLNPFSRNNLFATLMGAGSFLAGNSAGGATAVAGISSMAKGAKDGLLRSSRAQLLTDPQTARWFANIPKAEMQKGGLRKHIDTLVDIGNKSASQATRIAIQDYLNSLNQDERNR